MLPITGPPLAYIYIGAGSKHCKTRYVLTSIQLGIFYRCATRRKAPCTARYVIRGFCNYIVCLGRYQYHWISHPCNAGRIDKPFRRPRLRITRLFRPIATTLAIICAGGGGGGFMRNHRGENNWMSSVTLYKQGVVRRFGHKPWTYRTASGDDITKHVEIRYVHVY